MSYSPYGRCAWQHAGTLQGAGSASTGPIDVHDATDLWLEASIPTAPGGTSPSLTVQLDAIDAFGNVLPAVLNLAALSGSRLAAQASIGVHIPGAGSLVLPAQIQITWTLAGTNPVFTGAQISLFAR
jgi:hypothetical protein